MAVGTPDQVKLMDYDQFIDHQIRETRRRIKLTDLATAIVVLAAAALGLLFIEVVLDHVVGLSREIRLTILVLAGILGGLYAAWSIVRPLISSVNRLYAAKTIEDADPRFKHNLITYLYLREHETEEKVTAALRAVETKAVKDLAEIRIESVVNQNRLTHAIYALSAIIVLFCLYAWLTPKSILDSARRAFLADVERPTQTRLVGVQPGDDPRKARVVAGQDVEFAVETQGAQPSKVFLHTAIDPAEPFARLEMERGANRYDPWRTTLRNVQQDVYYYMTAGDGKTRLYRVEVAPAPRVETLRLDLEFPDYTGIPPRKGLKDGNVEALVGTWVHLQAKTNQPARSAYLEFSRPRAGTEEAPGADPARRPSIELTVDREDPTKLTGKFQVQRNQTYTIKFTTEQGHIDPRPVVYDIVARPDTPPALKFIEPPPVIQIPANAPLKLGIEASDDFGLRDLVLVFKRDGKPLAPARNLLAELQPVPKTPPAKYRRDTVVNLAELPLNVGDKVVYQLSATDVRRPEPNQQAIEQLLEIIEPLPEPERKEREQQLNDEQDQQGNPQNDANPQPQPQNQPQGGQERDANPQPQPPQDNPNQVGQEQDANPQPQPPPQDGRNNQPQQGDNQGRQNQPNQSADRQPGDPEAQPNPNDSDSRPNQGQPGGEGRGQTDPNAQPQPNNGMDRNSGDPRTDELSRGSNPPGEGSNPAPRDQSDSGPDPNDLTPEQRQKLQDALSKLDQNRNANRGDTPPESQGGQGQADPSRDNEPRSPQPNDPTQQERGGQGQQADPKAQQERGGQGERNEQMNDRQADPKAQQERGGQGQADPKAQQERGGQGQGERTEQMNDRQADPKAQQERGGQGQADPKAQQERGGQGQGERAEQMNDRQADPKAQQERGGQGQADPKAQQERGGQAQQADPKAQQERGGQGQADPKAQQERGGQGQADPKAQQERGGQGQADPKAQQERGGQGQADPKAQQERGGQGQADPKAQQERGGQGQADPKAQQERGGQGQADPKAQQERGGQGQADPKAQQERGGQGQGERTEQMNNRQADPKAQQERGGQAQQADPKAQQERGGQAQQADPKAQQERGGQGQADPKAQQERGGQGQGERTEQMNDRQADPKAQQERGGQGQADPKAQQERGGQGQADPKAQQERGGQGQGERTEQMNDRQADPKAQQERGGQGQADPKAQQERGGQGQGERTEQMNDRQADPKAQQERGGQGQADPKAQQERGGQGQADPKAQQERGGQGQGERTEQMNDRQADPKAQQERGGQGQGERTEQMNDRQADPKAQQERGGQGDPKGQSEGQPNPSGESGGRQQRVNQPGQGQPNQPGEGQANQPGRQGGQPDQGQAPDGEPSDQPGRGADSKSGGMPNREPGDNPFQPKERQLDPDAARVNPGEPPNTGPSPVAPDTTKNPVNLRRLKEALSNPDELRQLERDTGLSRQALEQFVKRYEGAPQRQALPGGEIDAQATGPEPTFDPNRTVPGTGPGSTISTRTNRAGGTLPQDNVRGLSEGLRGNIPAALRDRVRAYRSSLSKSALEGGSPTPSTLPAEAAPRR